MGKRKQAIRNSAARNPLLSKGGVHQKSGGAKRAAQKRELRAQVRNSPLLALFLAISLP